MNGPCEYCEQRPWTVEHGYGRTHIQICAECNVDYMREKEREDSEPERPNHTRQQFGRFPKS